MEFKEIEDDLKKKLKSSRFAHTLGVAETAKRLAKCYDTDVSQAYLAALLHDCAKYMEDDEKIELCKKYHVPITDAELKNPALLHAKCGAITAKCEYGITDMDILHAIGVHTTGVPEMNLLDKIIFVSDYIEPNRNQAPHLASLRRLAEVNLDMTVYRILEDTVSYLEQNSSQVMDPTTNLAYQYYKKLCKGEAHYE